jgi:hypothetical protein
MHHFPLELEMVALFCTAHNSFARRAYNLNAQIIEVEFFIHCDRAKQVESKERDSAGCVFDTLGVDSARYSE